MNDLIAMLNDCAPGWTRTETDHYWRFLYGGKTYPSFPKGPHGQRKNPEIQVGHVRKLARHLGIEVCARKKLDLG